MAEIALVAARPPGFDRMCFVASTERDRELLKKAGVGEGEVIIQKFRLIRNGKHHRLVFQMLRYVFKNQEHYSSEEDLREALTLQTSFVRKFRTLGGRWEKRARSWSYDEMDEADFSKLHDELVDVILALVYPDQLKRLGDKNAKGWLRAAVDYDAFVENLMGFV